jgi:integrase
MARPNRGPQLSTKPNAAGYYEIRWTKDGRSLRKSTGCSNARDAAEVYKAFLNGFNDQPRADTSKSNIARCLATYWQRHVVPKVLGKETAFYNIRSLVPFFTGMSTDGSTYSDSNVFFEALSLHAGGYHPHEITEELVQEYVSRRMSGRLGQKVTSGGVRRDLEMLRAALHKAAKWNHIPSFSFPGDSLPPAPEARDRWLTDAERDLLLAAADIEPDRLSRSYRFIALALGTASRKRAIETLTKAQVDLERGLIHLNPTGRRQTRKRRPTVPIAQWLRPIIERAMTESPTEYLLDHPGAIRTAFEGAVARSGLEGVTPHTLRHTWATRAAQNGVPLLDIAGVLGDRLETVMKTYLHHCPEHLRGAVDHWDQQKRA